MRRLFAIAVLTVLVAAACGGGGDKLTVDEYFAEVQRVSTEFDDATSEDIDFESLDGLQAGFRDARDANRDFLSAIKSISPPDELSELHNDTISDGEAAGEAINDLVDRVLDADSLDEVEQIFAEGTDELDRLSDAFTDRCFEIEAAAAERGIDIDLACG